MKYTNNFILLFIGLVFLILIPNLLQRGLFVDGLWYGVISENLANGLGSSWKPVFTYTMFYPFYEHPPLVFWVQSLFFKIFGSGLYTEKIYALVIFVLNVFLIKKVWQEVFYHNKELQRFWIIPVLLWFLNENTYLMYANNLLECTQVLFILAAVFLILKGVRTTYKYYFFIAGISIFGGFLSKGITGLFPLIATPLYYLFYNDRKSALQHSMIVFLGFFSSGALLLLEPEAVINLQHYFENQVLASLRGERLTNIQYSRFYIIKRLLEVSSIALILSMIITGFSYFKYKQRLSLHYKTSILFFVALGLSGVLPIMLSIKQAGYYLITTTPFFAMALSLVVVEHNNILIALKHSKIFKVITICIIVLSLCFSYLSWNTTNKRDSKIITDLEVLDTILTQNSNTVIGSKTRVTEHAMYGYMMRYYKISIDTTHYDLHPLLLIDKEIAIDTAHYSNVTSNTTKFEVYRRKTLD